MKTIELHDAFLFACDDCGRDNFVRAITVSPESIDDIDEEDEEILSEMQAALQKLADNFQDIDLIKDFGVTFTRRPTIVECEFCGSEFHTNDPEGEDD
jgi:hypothetical protein